MRSKSILRNSLIKSMETLKSAAEITCEKLKGYLDQCSDQEVWPKSNEIDRIIGANFATVVNTRSEQDKANYRLGIMELNRRELELDEKLKRAEEIKKFIQERA